MRSNAIDDIEAQLQMENNLIDLYTDIHAVGCFTCSGQESLNEDECIDICNDSNGLLSREDWDSYFDDFDSEIDHGCGHAIISVLDTATQTSILSFNDVLAFAESLVYDDRENRCYAYDPRDDYKRRLQTMDEETCQSFDCFNCAYTAGQCEWDSVLNMCDKPSRQKQNQSKNETKKKRWWEWYGDCEDNLGLCFTNANGLASMAGGTLGKALKNGEMAHF